MGTLGYVAVTHQDWFRRLESRRFWDEVNFWRPSAHHSFNGPPGSPFGEMEARLNEIRTRNRFVAAGPVPQIGCILLSSAIFFPQDMWVAQPADWAPRNLTYQRYKLEQGEGRRAAGVMDPPPTAERYGTPHLVAPRLGQGTFRVAVTDAYARACAVTGEHSLPALEAAHIRPYAKEGPHAVSNGLLLRADLHRLFDQGYLTVTPGHNLEVSVHGNTVSLPASAADRPGPDFLRWHNEHVFRA